ncbi:MAG: TetR/AcrR family transcriptional regulator [Candidatus Sericytochromatia bacterium]
MTPEGLRARKKREKWQRIEAAAWEVFWEKGFEAATTREIAARADVAVGTLFLYARDKRELLVLLVHKVIDQVVGEAFERLDGTGGLIDDVMSVFGRLFAMYAERPAIARAFVKEVLLLGPDQREEVIEKVQAFYGRLGERIAQAQAAGEVDRAIMPMQVASTMFGLYTAALTAWLSGWMTREEALEGHLRPMLDLLMRGLAPEGSRG